MATKLIELEDGILFEIDVPGEQIEQISGGMADKINASLSRVKPVLINICEPITAAWNELKLNQGIYIKEAEIELGLSFEGEGNVYVTKAKAGANLTVRLLLQPKEK